MTNDNDDNSTSAGVISPTPKLCYEDRQRLDELQSALSKDPTLLASNFKDSPFLAVTSFGIHHGIGRKDVQDHFYKLWQSALEFKIRSLRRFLFRAFAITILTKDNYQFHRQACQKLQDRVLLKLSERFIRQKTKGRTQQASVPLASMESIQRRRCTTKTTLQPQLASLRAIKRRRRAS